MKSASRRGGPSPAQQDTSDTKRRSLILFLSGWAEFLRDKLPFERLLVFGSLINSGGDTFLPRVSDIDLLAVFRPNLPPLERVQACESLLRPLKKAERALSKLLPNRRRKRVLSLGALTDSEFAYGINIKNDQKFYSSLFLDLFVPGAIPTTLPRQLLHSLHSTYAPLVLGACQDYRKQFLAVDLAGKCTLKDHRADVDSDILPKALEREAARLAHWLSEINGTSSIAAGQHIDVVRGCQFLTSLLTALDNQSLNPLLRRIQTQMTRPDHSLRITPKEQLFLWELLAERANQALSAVVPASAAPSADALVEKTVREPVESQVYDDWPIDPPALNWPVADHSEVKDAFAQILTRTATIRVLPILGGTETGKSLLTRQFQANATRILKAVPCGRFDFKGSSDLDSALRWFADELKVSEPKRGSGLVPQLEEIFCQLKKRARPTLLIFDTFDHAAEPAWHWTHSLLHATKILSWLRVIVAGQRVPNPCQSSQLIKLSPPLVQEWWEYGRGFNPLLRLDQVQNLHQEVRGSVRTLSQVLSMQHQEQLAILEAAHGSPALLAFASIDLTHDVLSATERTRLKEALQAAAVPHWFDCHYLAALLQASAAEASRLFDQLRALHTVEPFPARGVDAMNVHESARLALREHLRENDRARWLELSRRARAYIAPNEALHAQIEALYHLFAIEPNTAAVACEALDRQLTFDWRPEIRRALALALNELTAAGWLTGAAQLEAVLVPLVVRGDRGEAAQLEAETRGVLQLCGPTSHASQHSRVQRLLGEVLHEKGQFDESMRAFRECLGLCRRLAEREPFNPDWQLELALAQRNIGIISQHQGRLDDAIDALYAYRTICQHFASLNPSDIGWKHHLANAHDKVGQALEAQGRLGEAMATFRNSLAISENLAQVDPSRTYWQQGLATAHARIGGILQAQSQLDDALTAFGRCLSIARRLTSVDPSDTYWRRRLAEAYARIGTLRQAQDRLSEAGAAFDEYLSILRHLASDDPFNADLQRELAAAYSRVGAIAQEQDHTEESLAWFRESLAISQRLVAIDSTNTSYQRELADAHSRVGGISLEGGFFDEAMADFLQSRSILQDLASIAPVGTDWTSALAFANWRVGDVAQAQGRLEDALQAYVEYLRLSERLVAIDPSNPKWQRDLADAHSVVGDIFLKQGRLNEAMCASRECLDISEHLVSIDSTNADWLRERALAQCRIGDVSLARAEFSEAISAYQAYLDGSLQLAAADPANADWQRQIADGHYKLGHALPLAGRVEDGRRQLRASLAALERAVEISPATLDWKEELDRLRSVVESAA